MTTRRPVYACLACLLMLWVGLLLLAGGAMAAWQYRSLLSELEKESILLLRLVSQRAGQHDAHLTALSAVASASQERNDALFQDVAQTITHFYPRIDEVRLVDLDRSASETLQTPVDAALDELVRAAAQASKGEITLLSHPHSAHHYLMIKRSPNTDEARYGLMLGVDARKLMEGAGDFWLKPGVLLRLSLPDGQLLTGPQEAAERPQFRREISSASQALVLESGLDIGWRELLPVAPTGLLLLALSLLYAAAIAVWRQRARVQAAEEQARLSALESRQAHASRVNTLGEMASGLMHELTQPLTAILAQTQASVRLLAQGRHEVLQPALEGTVTQARRASAILDRFRNWSRPQPGQITVFDVRAALRNVQALLTPQAAASGAQLEFLMPNHPVWVRADSIEMEQLLFNLVRNAIEAVSVRTGEARVVTRLSQQSGRVIFEVTDNGPGVNAEMREKLFTPFATTRDDGMGLGLALSKRLAERMEGDLVLVDSESGATFRLEVPGVDPRQEAQK